jgi:AcrR family transcriptional regulator
VSATRRKYAQRLPPKERRQQVLDVARRIIVEHGFPALSMEAIAREAGVTRPVVYSAYPNLPAVLAALLEREERVAVTHVEAIIPADPGDADPDEVLLAALDGFLHGVAAAPLTWQLILLPIEGAPSLLHKRIERNRERLLGRLFFSVAMEAGRLLLTEPERYPAERFHAFAESVIKALRPTKS